MSQKGPHSSPQRQSRREIAQSTLDIIQRGAYSIEGVGDVTIADDVSRCLEHTTLYGVQSVLSEWRSDERTEREGPPSSISVLGISALEAAQYIANENGGQSEESSRSPEKVKASIGILNFASAKNPGGGFQSGASAQEESIARASTLYSSLTGRNASGYYTLHKLDPRSGFYSHTMIYSPGVIIIRDDRGTLHQPVKVDVLTSPAVNVSAILAKLKRDKKDELPDFESIERVMRERAARVLYAFELNSVKTVVLGAWGCGVFGNDVKTVASIWADLLGREGSRFAQSFDRVVFAVLGDQFEAFKEAFEERCSVNIPV